MTKTTPTAGCCCYHLEKQDMHAGGSGCRCSAAVFNDYLLRGLQEGPLEAPALRPHRGAAEPPSSFQGGVHPPASVMRWHFPPQRKSVSLGLPERISLRRRPAPPDRLFIDRTQLTPARILTGYVVAGVLLQAVGVYQYLVDWAAPAPPSPSPASDTVLPRAWPRPWRKKGPIGILTGGLTATSGGIAAAVVFAVLAAIFFKPKEKR